ncbi:hypothetical protein EMCRGX_G024698 [Ephydatia muelleri]
MEAQRKQTEALIAAFAGEKAKREPPPFPVPAAAIPSFVPFDATVELWTDYSARFHTILGANSVPAEKRAQVFLTNQSREIYKLLSNLASQQSPVKGINDLSLDEGAVQVLDRKPGETIQELAARIRHDAVTCDFSEIHDPLNEALRTRFMCSVKNEAVLKALFKIKDGELTFARAITVAMETEEAAKVAKETVYGSIKDNIHVVYPSKSDPSQKSNAGRDFPKGTCPRCGKTDHKASDCPSRNAVCHYCQKTGHLQTVKGIRAVPQLQQNITMNDKRFVFEVDTGAGDNFCTMAVWKQLGNPTLLPTTAAVALQGTNSPSIPLQFTVTKVPHLNLLGRDAIVRLGINVSALMGLTTSSVHPISNVTKPDINLQNACKQLCQEFPDLFKPELGCLKDVQLEVRFKPDSKPVFCKPRVVPLAIQDELGKAYNAGITRGVWQPTQFNDYGTPVVPIRKATFPGQTKSTLRVCGDYSVTVNPQLEEHRYPMPRPEDLMQRLGGGHGFTKIDLADAYNQIQLSPESQKRLALSTHRGVLLQMRLPFGISSAPGYFQELMDKLTCDLQGVAVYMDDILVSGATDSEHLQNLRSLLKRLVEKGLRCRLEKCSFAQSSIEYLGHTLSRQGVSKGKKVDAVKLMPPPENVSTLRSFLGSVQFYGKFLPNLATITEPLHSLTKKGTTWTWKSEQAEAFQKVKDLLSDDTVLAHFDPSLPVGISCDASEVGIGAVLFHRYPDASERPICNASKTLTPTQRGYSQIQKEALAIIFALSKFHQFLYGRPFILVTDHKPLLALFGPTKATPALAANRLARWALMLSQYQYTIEYRKTSDHGNADALSRLPVGPDSQFDEEEDMADVDTVCTIKIIGSQLNPMDPGILAKESGKDPVISKVMKYTREGWPPNKGSEVEAKGDMEIYRKLAISLSTAHGCLLYGSRVVIPPSLQSQVLQLLHLGHFGMQRMKQLARTAVYWPHIDSGIMELCHKCTTCAEHQNKPPKPANHPWMLPEKPWSRVHVDHAINFLGSNWLVLIDAFSKYPCIHPTSSTSTKSTTELLEQDFAHFGYPHSIVSDNATSFTSEEFQSWCRERGIIHLTGHQWSSRAPALQEFLMQYRRTPLADGYSPSELLNGRQIRAKIDTLLPSPAHMAQARQAREATKAQAQENPERVTPIYNIGTPCYALYCGPRQEKDPKWVPAVVTKVFGSRSVNVRVIPRGGTWRRHIEQLRPRYGVEEDADPGKVPTQEGQEMLMTNAPSIPEPPSVKPRAVRTNPRWPTGSEYGPGHPRRSTRQKPHH